MESEEVTNRYTKEERQLLADMIMHVHQLSVVEEPFRSIIGLPEGTFDGGYILSNSYFGAAFELFNSPLTDMPRYINDSSTNKKAIALWRLEIGR